MDAQLVRNLNCAIQDIVYKRAYHSQYGMDCKIAPPCLLVNLLLVGQSGCTIPAVQQLPPLTQITVEII